MKLIRGIIQTRILSARDDTINYSSREIRKRIENLITIRASQNNIRAQVMDQVWNNFDFGLD